MNEAQVVVVGAGLAGLTAARALAQGGRQVVVLEAAAQLGGRVKTREVDGYLLDAGFQVLFTAYPAVRRNLDLRALDLVELPPGVLLRGPRGDAVLGDPLRRPADRLPTLRAHYLTPKDKLLILRLRNQLLVGPAYRLLQGEDQPTLDFLRGYGFSEGALAAFLGPFLGGIFLRRDLQVSARLFLYYFRLMAEGKVALPRRGMGQVALQLADGLDLRLGAKVEALEGGSPGILRTPQGDWRAQEVVLATDPPELARLLGIQLPVPSLPCISVYYTSPKKLEATDRLILNAREGLINHALWVSNVNPGCAPQGRHLLSLTLLGESALSDPEIDTALRWELEWWYKPLQIAELELLQIERIPHAQFAQPPGYAAQLPSLVSGRTGVWVAGEITSMSGLQGALESGERAAAALLGDVAALGRPRGA